MSRPQQDKPAYRKQEEEGEQTVNKKREWLRPSPSESEKRYEISEDISPS